MTIGSSDMTVLGQGVHAVEEVATCVRCAS